MAYHLETVEPEAAQGTLQSTYATLQEMFMMVPKVFVAQSIRPDLLEPIVTYVKRLMIDDHALPRKGSIAVDDDGHDQVALVVLPSLLSRTHRSLDDDVKRVAGGVGLIDRVLGAKLHLTGNSGEGGEVVLVHSIEETGLCEIFCGVHHIPE